MAESTEIAKKIICEHFSQAELIENENSVFVRIGAKSKIGGIEIVLEDSKIGKWEDAFTQLLDLASKGATSEELRAFANGNKLKDASKNYLKIAKGVVGKRKGNPVYISIPDGTTKIDGDVVGGLNFCDSLVSIVIPPSLTELTFNSLRQCKSLNEVVLPDTLTKIGKYSFYIDEALPSITIPASVKEIEICAFAQCSSLSEIKFKGTVSEWKEIKKDKEWNRFVAAKSVLCSDGEVPFENFIEEQGEIILWKSIEENVAIPEGIKKIRKNAFRQDYYLKSLTLSDSVTEIGEEVFWHNDNLSSVTLSKNLEKIASLAFAYCKSLSKITLPSSIKEIGRHAFVDCKLLSEIRYEGTKSDWEKVIKDNWTAGCPCKSVISTDGEVSLE